MLNALDRRKFLFLSKIALKYRLSLDNLCRIMHIDLNEDNKINLYQNFLIANPNDEDALRFLLCCELVSEYDKKKDGEYPIEYKIERGLEEKLESDLKRSKVNAMLNKYNALQKEILYSIPKSIELAKKRNDEKLLELLNSKLDKDKEDFDQMTDKLTICKEDIDFENFFLRYKKEKALSKKEGKNIHISPSDGLIISRYRYIHALSQVKMCEKLDIVVKTLKKFEEGNKDLDPILYLKIKKLDTHLYDFYFSNRLK